MVRSSLRTTPLLAIVSLSALAPGCPSERPLTNDTQPPAPEPGHAAPFENPGGMWLPEQMAQHEDQLRLRPPAQLIR